MCAGGIDFIPAIILILLNFMPKKRRASGKLLHHSKRENKRDEARGKLKDPKVLDDIYKKLYIMVPRKKKTKK